MDLCLIASKFPNHESELTILPHAGDNQSNFEDPGTDKFSVQQIKKLGLAGFYLNQLPASESEIETYDLNRKLYDSNNNPKAFPLANLFIPTTEGSYIDRLIVNKKIDKFVNNTFERTKTSILSQVKEIETSFKNLISELNEPPGKIPIIFVFWSKVKTENDDQVKKLSKDIHNYFTTESQIELFEARADCVLMNDSVEVRRKTLLQPVNCCSLPNPLLQMLILKAPSETRFKITRRIFNCAGSLRITLSNVENTLKLFKAYFPGIEDCLETLPNFNRICDNLLGKLSDCSPTDAANNYLGEVKDFWEKVVSPLDSPNGLLIHGYEQHHLNQVLRQPCNCFFEFDWLLVGNGSFTIFEVGRSANPSLPTSTVVNKLSDDKSLQKMYMMQKIVYLILREISNLSDIELKHIAAKSVKLVIVFTNSNRIAVQKSIGLKKKYLEKLKIVKNCQVLIMTGENSNIVNNAGASTPSLKLFELGAELQLQESALSSDNLFSIEVAHDLSGGSEGSWKLIKYVAAILSFSYLLNLNTGSQPSCELDPPLNCPLDINERFMKQANNITPGTSHLDIILSPQQHAILDENPDNIFLVAEPGTGKTAVLLAKAFYAALNDRDVEHVIISFPSEKTDFKEFIVNFSESQNIPNDAKKKLKFLTLEELSLITKAQLQVQQT